MFEGVGASEAGDGVPRGLRWVEGTVSVITAVLLASLMLITEVDVVGRYALNRALAGAAEWTELALGLMILGGIFQAAARSEHIRIDLLDHLWGPARLRLLTAFSHVLSGLLLLFIAWRLWAKARELAQFGDVSAYLGVPLAPLAYVMAGLAVLAAVAYAFQARARATRTLDDADRREEAELGPLETEGRKR